MVVMTILRLSLVLCFLTPTLSWGEEPVFRAPPDDAEGLVAFWDFQEPDGQPFTSRGAERLALEEPFGKVERTDGGILGPRAIRIRVGQQLRVPRDKLGRLNIHGPKAQVTLMAWIKRDSPRYWQSIAGVWDETHEKRQYMLFLNARWATDQRTMERFASQDRIHGHVSSVGGPTPGKTFCYTYSSGATGIPMQRWTWIAMTYDGQFSRVYVDGRLDAHEHTNPFPYDKGLFDGGDEGADFTIGANHVAGRANNNPFGGWMSGVAVFDRALDDKALGWYAPQAPNSDDDHP